MRGLPCGRDKIFSWIIANNFVRVYHILTKLGTKMSPYTTSLCTKFQVNRITCFHFMVTFTPLRKEGKKEKKLSQFLKIHISETPGTIYLKFGMWGTDGGVRLHSKNCPVSYKQHEVTYMRKLRYCSSCQYTHGCGAPASWAAQYILLCFLISAYICVTHRVLQLSWS